MVKRLKESNGYPDNNFTEQEYFDYIELAKEKLEKFLYRLDELAQKEISINDRGDYNSILRAEDEDDLRRRSALLGAIENLVYIQSLYDRR